MRLEVASELMLDPMSILMLVYREDIFHFPHIVKKDRRRFKVGSDAHNASGQGRVHPCFDHSSVIQDGITCLLGGRDLGDLISSGNETIQLLIEWVRQCYAVV